MEGERPQLVRPSVSAPAIGMLGPCRLPRLACFSEFSWKVDGGEKNKEVLAWVLGLVHSRALSFGN